MPSAEAAYLFRHALMRDAAYALQLPSERAGLHRDAFEVLKQDPEAEGSMAADLADHAREANLHSPQATLAAAELYYLVLAARHARSVYQPAREIDLRVRIAQHGQCSRDVAAEQLRLAAHALAAMGRAPEAEPLLTRALDLAQRSGVRELQLSVRLSQLDVYRLTGRRAMAHAALPALVAELRELGDSRALSQAEMEQEEVFRSAGDQVNALATLLRGLEVARRMGDTRQEAEVLARVAACLHRMGKTEEGEQRALEGLALSCAAGDQHAESKLNHTLGVIYVESDRIDEARCRYRRAMDLAAATGRLHAEAVLAGNLANVEYFFRGDLQLAGVLYAKSQQFFAEAGDLDSCANASRQVGSVKLVMGDYPAALVWFRESTRCARQAGNVFVEAEARRFAAQARAMIDAAHFDLNELLEVAQLSSRSRAYKNLQNTVADAAQQLTQQGLFGAARRLWQQLLQMHSRTGSNVNLTPIARAVQFQVLMGEPLGVQPLIDELQEELGNGETPHHHVSSVLVPQFRLAMLGAAGLFGTAHLQDDAWPGWGRASETLARMSDLIAGPVSQFGGIRTIVGRCAAALQELQQAFHGKRPALLFRGLKPDDITAPCRAAVLDQLRLQDPHAFGSLVVQNPELLAAMQGAVPDWRAGDLPGSPVAGLETALRQAFAASSAD